MANSSVTDARAKAGEAADKAAERGREVASEAAAKAREVGSDAASAARDVASSVADAGRSAARAAGQAADSATARAGEGVEAMGRTVREYGPDSGMLGTATETVASGLERGGQYLEEQGLSGIAGDLTEMIKRNPIPALLLGVGVGFLLARMTSSRS